MIDEALKSLRTLFLSTLVVTLLWFVTYPSAIEKLEQYKQARELQAWLLLKELIWSFELDVFEFDYDESIHSYEVERISPTPQGGDFNETMKLEIDTTWPDETKYKITFEPESYYYENSPKVIDYARIYRIKAEPNNLPFSNYLVVFADNKRFVVPADDNAFRVDSSRGLRMIMVASRNRFRPKYWPKISNQLNSLGFSDRPEKLFTGIPSLANFYSNSDPRLPSAGVQVFGLKLSISLFFSSIGLILAAIAFACIGPMMALRRSKGSSRQTWIMSLPFSLGLIGVCVEALVSLISLVWVMTPPFILYLQFTAGSGAEGLNTRAISAGFYGFSFASIIFLFAIWELRKIRMRRGWSKGELS